LREIFCVDSKGNSIPLEKCKTPSLERCNDIKNLINKYSDKFEINTPLRMAHFLGQIGVESNKFNAMGTKSGENPCYTENNIAWKHSAGRDGWIANKLWSENPIVENCDDYSDEKYKKRKHPTWNTVEDVPDKYICSKANPKTVSGKNLLSYVYRCEGGNGNEESEDGYTYRGHGVMQITWKKQYIEFNTWLKKQGFTDNYKNVVSNPDVAFKDTDIDMLSAMWYWDKTNCNVTADNLKEGVSMQKFEGIIRKINSGLKQNKERWEIFGKAISIIK
jgi:predicted chitinase